MIILLIEGLSCDGFVYYPYLYLTNIILVLVMATIEKYDRIGIDYNQTRKADPFLLEQLYTLLQPQVDKVYVDMGCGTGNYTIGLHKMGVNIIGIDPSQNMLDKASANEPTISWLQGKAQALPPTLTSESIDGMVATLTLHHWEDLTLSFQELAKVLKPHAPIVIFTSTPDQMKGYWLNAYFPQMLKDSIDQMPSFHHVAQALLRAGFSKIERKKYVISPHLVDMFLYSGKQRPHLYLNAAIRQGISSFSDLSNQEEVKAGLEKLEQDMQSGRIKETIAQYENELGDYLFITARK